MPESCSADKLPQAANPLETTVIADFEKSTACISRHSSGSLSSELSAVLVCEDSEPLSADSSRSASRNVSDSDGGCSSRRSSIGSSEGFRADPSADSIGSNVPQPAVELPVPQAAAPVVQAAPAAPAAVLAVMVQPMFTSLAQVFTVEVASGMMTADAVGQERVRFCVCWEVGADGVAREVLDILHYQCASNDQGEDEQMELSTAEEVNRARAAAHAALAAAQVQ